MPLWNSVQVIMNEALRAGRGLSHFFGQAIRIDRQLRDSLWLANRTIDMRQSV